MTLPYIFHRSKIYFKYKYETALDHNELIDEFLTYLTDICGIAALEDYYTTSDITQILKDGYQLGNVQD